MGALKAHPPRSARWRIEDVIDLETFLEEDRSRPGGELRARDQVIAEAIAKRPGAASSDRTRLAGWLEERRGEVHATGRRSVGELFAEARQAAAFFFGAAGFAGGAVLASAHLGYYGERPINALVFFFLALGPQLALLAALLVAGILRGRWTALPGFAPVAWLVRAVLLKLVPAPGKAFGSLEGRSRLALAAAWGAVRAKQAVYGSIWAWPILIVAQIFAAWFNLGILAATTLLVAVSNRAFGWETTLQVAPGSMLRFVEIVSTPWSWLLPNAHPTLDQIRQSRVALHGASDYASDALASWWPFLCYAVVFYGLLPRLGLWLWAASRERRALASLPLDHPDCHEILRRMTPLVIAGPPGPALSFPADESVPPGPDRGRCAVVVPHDSILAKETLEGLLRQRGWEPCAWLRAEFDCASANDGVYDEIEKLAWNGALPRVIAAVDPDRDPIKAIQIFLRRLRRLNEGRTAVTVFLPAEAKPAAAGIWKQVIRALQDPYLAVECGPRHE